MRQVDYFYQCFEDLKSEAAHLFAPAEIYQFWSFIDGSRTQLAMLLLKHENPNLRASEMEAFFEPFFQSINYPNDDFAPEDQLSLRRQFYTLLEEICGPFPVMQHVLMAVKFALNEAAQGPVGFVVHRHRVHILNMLRSDQSPDRIALGIDQLLDPVFSEHGHRDSEDSARSRFFNLMQNLAIRIQSDSTVSKPSDVFYVFSNEAA